MPPSPVACSARSLRRLAVTNQRLSGDLDRAPTTPAVVAAVRDVAFVQWDPVTVVAPSHLLSLWARFRRFRPSDLERWLWREKRLFVHWTPIASLVLTEDYPLYYSLMRRYPGSLSSAWGNQREYARTFLRRHRALGKSLLAQLRRGPRLAKEFEAPREKRAPAGGWSSGTDVSNMLFHLHMRGEVMVVGHEGIQNVWGLTEEFLPTWAEKRPLSASEVDRTAAQRAIRALGAASPQEIRYYFPPGRYGDLDRALHHLERSGTVRRLRVAGAPPRDVRYVLAEDVPRLEALEREKWSPGVALLPPFDTAVRCRRWLNLVFGFDYKREQFFPKERRQYGTYVLPILSGDRFVGRVDPVYEKAERRLVLKAVHPEPSVNVEASEIRAIGTTIRQLGKFLGAQEIVYPERLASAWDELRG